MSSNVHEDARRSVLNWCNWYTRGLPENVAAERRQEIASDLHEHVIWATGQQHAAPMITRSIRMRAWGGALADLSWRRAQLRVHETHHERELRLRTSGGLSVVAFTVALLACVASGFVVIRLLMSTSRGGMGVPSEAIGLALLAFAVCVCGVALLVSRRTRWVGALWMIIALYCLLRYSSIALAQVSTSYWHLSLGTQNWDQLTQFFALGLGIFFVGLAVRWMPPRAAATANSAPSQLAESLSADRAHESGPGSTVATPDEPTSREGAL